MRALLLLAGLTVLSITSANAANTQSTPANAGPLRCNVMGWPRFSAVPCRNYYNFANYTDCVDKVKTMGYNGNEIWWGCSNIDYKK
ncbi:MAG TPA: hypothetical protein VMM15_15870 [Bradyrhizobium sp.]|nr:hypothetical protein [Bradyrhizobium sp.]